MSNIDQIDIIETIQRSKGLTYAQICKKLSARGNQKDIIKKELKKLVKANKIFRDKDKKYTFNTYKKQETAIGRIEIHEKGFGFVRVEDGLDDDIFIASKNLKGASHLELVKVKILSEKIGKKREGKVIEILVEEGKEWIGVVFEFEAKWFFCPWGQRASYPLPKKDIQKYTFKDSDIVLATLNKQSQKKDPTVAITKHLGNIDDPAIDSQILIHEFNLDHTFSDHALEEAQHPTQKDPCQDIRQDLTELAFVTIDGEDAKDFDDAVYFDEKGHLWVAIADVSQYVKPNSTLDVEACERGNSFYFPDQVVPMLPENLSNYLCSLRPFEQKHAMVVQISFEQNLQPKLEQITPAIIESKARLTYNLVSDMLDGKQEMEFIYKNSLTRLAALTDKLYKKRIENGAIDFDMPEIRYFNQEITPVQIKRNKAHHLIEECMLATNQVTSEFVDSHGFPNVYRVHEPPDPMKLADTVAALHTILDEKDRWQTPQDAFDIQDILSDLSEHPFFTQMQYLFLRAMAQARYHTEKLGHFGLGFEYYSHFTSPIRRYADLVLHRIIKKILLKHDLRKPLFPKPYQSLDNVCIHISKQDRKSLMIEREIKKIKGIRYMQTQKDKTFDGVISGILQKGIFVETSAFGIEGFISEQQLRKAGYTFQSSSNQFRSRDQTLHYGSNVQVRVLETNLFKRQLNFSIDQS